MKVLISGGCGQIGSHVAELFLKRGDQVLAIDNLATGRREHLADHPNLTVVIDTIADKKLIDKLVSEFKPDAIVHTAASYKDPEDWYNDTLTNCVGGSVKPLQQPIRLDHPKFPANSSYAITKTANEDFLEISGLDFVTFRLANVVGPRNVSGPLPIFFQRLKDGKKCFVTNARRDFVYVLDLAKNVVKACDGVGSGAYHFSSGTDVAIQELYDAVVEAMEITPYPEAEMKLIGEDDAPSILLDPSKTFADFGKIEFTPLKQTVKAAIDYFKIHGTLGEYTHLKIEKEK